MSDRNDNERASFEAMTTARDDRDPNRTVHNPPGEGPGDRIGPYKLLREINHGGMGVVYLAEQQEPQTRNVALKVIRNELIEAGLDTREVLERFQKEWRALAQMNHPDIAKVLDAGTTGSGRPYFVMEWVDGIPITRFC